ncbi:MAG: magnesium transporter [Candidatus Paceibacterota bacterium]
MNKKIQNIAHEVTYHPEDRIETFKNLLLSEQALVFEELSPHVRQDVMAKLSNEELVNLLDEMDLQTAENMLATMKDHKRRKKVISNLKTSLKEKAEYFLRFHPKAAMSLLNFNYLLLSSDTTINETADIVEKHYRETSKLPEILVQENGVLIGEVHLSSLVKEDNNKKLKDYVVNIRKVSYQADIHKIVELFKAKPHGKLVVLDKDESVIGVIYSDDALSLFENDPSAFLYDFAGVVDSERSFDNVKSKFKHRYKWLMINLITAFMAAAVVGLFEDTLSQLVVLAIYMPIIAGMGGNAATQTLAVIVRGITIGEIDLKTGKPAILKEVGAGFLNGVLNGVIVGLVAVFFNASPLLGLVLAVAMIFNLVIAGFFGAFIPLFMKSIGKDPATSATIFITTATDMFGFFIFLGLATLVLL